MRHGNNAAMGRRRFLQSVGAATGAHAVGRSGLAGTAAAQDDPVDLASVAGTLLSTAKDEIIEEFFDAISDFEIDLSVVKDVVNSGIEHLLEMLELVDEHLDYAVSEARGYEPPEEGENGGGTNSTDASSARLADVGAGVAAADEAPAPGTRSVLQDDDCDADGFVDELRCTAEEYGEQFWDSLDVPDDVIDTLQEFLDDFDDMTDLISDIASDIVEELFWDNLPSFEDIADSVFGAGESVVSFDVLEKLNLDLSVEPDIGIPVEEEPQGPEDLVPVSDAAARGTSLGGTGAGLGSAVTSYLPWTSAGAAAPRRDAATMQPLGGEEVKPLVFEECGGVDQTVIATPMTFNIGGSVLADPSTELWIGRNGLNEGCVYLVLDLEEGEPLGVDEVVEEVEVLYETVQELIEDYREIVDDTRDCFDIGPNDDPLISQFNERTLGDLAEDIRALITVIDALHDSLDEHGDPENFEYDLTVMAERAAALEAALLQQYNHLTWFDHDLDDVDQRVGDIADDLQGEPVAVDLNELEQTAIRFRANLSQMPTASDDQAPGDVLLQRPRDVRSLGLELLDMLQELVIRSEADVEAETDEDVGELLDDLETFLEQHRDGTLAVTDAVEQAAADHDGDGESFIEELDNLADALEGQSSDTVREFAPALPEIACAKCCAEVSPWNVIPSDIDEWAAEQLWNIVTTVWDFLVDGARALADAVTDFDQWFYENVWPFESKVWYRIVQLILAIIIVIVLVIVAVKAGVVGAIGGLATAGYYAAKAVVVRILTHPNLYRYLARLLLSATNFSCDWGVGWPGEDPI